MTPESRGGGTVNAPILFMSLFMALMLWGVVYTQDTTLVDRPITLKLEYLENLDPKLILVSPPATASVYIHTTEDNYADLKKKQLSASVSLSRAQVGRHSYPIALPRLIRDMHESSASVDLTIEPLEHKVMALQTQTKGKLSDPNVLLHDKTVVPTFVNISGPRSAIERVNEARIMLDLSKEDPANPTPISDDIFLYDSRGVQIKEGEEGITKDHNIGEVTPIFSSAPQEKTVFVLARFRGKANKGYISSSYQVSPEQVTITGTSQALARLSQVETDPIDLTGLVKDRQFVVMLKLPPGVSKCQPDRVKVRVSIIPATVPTNP